MITYYQNYKQKSKENCWKYQGMKLGDQFFTRVDFDRLYQLQGGRCKLCKIHQSELKTALCVDHNHQTGQVRGLLCQRCNKGLGWFEEDQATIQRALTYLKTQELVK